MASAYTPAFQVSFCLPTEGGKRMWLRCGTAFINEKGQYSLQLTSIPVGAKWNGWLYFFPLDDKPPPRATDNAGKRGSHNPVYLDESDIPF
jgi:hypothetical protein